MMKHSFLVLSLFLFIFGAVFAQETNLTAACVESYDEAVDYFPEKITVEYAENFSVEYHNSYKVVTVTPWQDAEVSFTYVLVQCGAAAPEGIEADAIVEVPVQRFVSMSTTILPHLENQNLLDRLVGVDTLMWTTSDTIMGMADDLTLIGGGGSFDQLNVEVTLELNPDLIMTQQFSAGESTSSVLADAGLPFVLNSDFADTSPLAQAEWGKFIALFFNTEALATEQFEAVETEYNELKALAENIPAEERVSVIAASPYAGTWYMPGGDSTVAKLIADAGGNFLFADEAGTSLSLAFEVVYEEGANADFWVNVNQFWADKEAALADDARYADFAAFQNGNMWNNNRIMNENGGSGYFESGVANPQLLLADLIAIFYPELLPEHEFVYYQPLG